MPDSNAVVTSAKEWKSKSSRVVGWVEVLPSGKSARITKSKIFFSMLRNGRLPNPLGKIVTQMIGGVGSTDDIVVSGEDLGGDEGLGKLMTFIDEIVCDCFLEPKVVIRPTDAPVDWQPDEDEIEIDDIDLPDRMYVFQVAVGGATDLTAFRQQSATDVSTGPDVQAVGPTAVLRTPSGGRPLPSVVPG